MRITLIENFRAVFYTPFYAPIALGTYAAEGLDVVIKTSSDAAMTIRSLIAGDGEVSWGGLNRLMAGVDANPARVPVAFCEVIGRDPFFLLGREPNPAFQLADLLGKNVATVAEVPAPWMCLQHDLRLAGIDPARIRRTPERPMAQNVAALCAGDVDVVQVFEPFAHELAARGAAHVWRAAANRGPATYTTLNTTRDFAERQPAVLLGMTRAMYRAQTWIATHEGEELARAVAWFFPGMATSTLAACFDGYKALDVWSRSPVVSRPGFEWIREAGLSNGRIARRYSYEECIDPTFAEAAMNGVSLKSREAARKPLPEEQ